MTHGVSKMGKAVGEKKLTLYFRRVMIFQVLNDVLPGVFVREYVCVSVCVCMLIFYRTWLYRGSQLYNPIHKKNAAWLKLVCSISIMFLSPNG